jgi:hypothetical protein
MNAEEALRVADRRRMALPALAAELKRELEWIPLKAMRKDRTERYQTATELSIDVQNYLDGLPLIAGPESQVYRARKFIRRNKLIVGVCVLFVLMLIAVSITLAMLLRERERGRQIAEESLRIAAERQQAIELKDEADRKAAEAARLREEAEKQREAATIAMNEMIKNLRFTDLTPQQRQQLLTSGVLAVVAKDPSMLTGLMRQLQERGEPPAPPVPPSTRPTTRKWQLGIPGPRRSP